MKRSILVFICMSFVVSAFAEDLNIWQRVREKWYRTQNQIADTVKEITDPQFEGTVSFSDMKNCFSQLNFDHDDIVPLRPKVSTFVDLVGQRRANALIVRKNNFVYIIQDDKVTKTPAEGGSRSGCRSSQDTQYYAMDRYDNDGDNSGEMIVSMKLLDFDYNKLHARGISRNMPRTTICSGHEIATAMTSPSRVPTELTPEKHMEEIEDVIRTAIEDRVDWIADHINSTNRMHRGFDTLKTMTDALKSPGGACFKVFGMSGYLGGKREAIMCRAGDQPQGFDCSTLGNRPSEPQGRVITR